MSQHIASWDVRTLQGKKTLNAEQQSLHEYLIKTTSVLPLYQKPDVQTDGNSKMWKVVRPSSRKHDLSLRKQNLA